MPYIPRFLEKKFTQISNEYSCLLVTGPRQVGKTAMLEHLMENEPVRRSAVTLDDLSERSLARRDPEMFLNLHPAPVLIDEAQYAPQLFSWIKIKVDRGAPPGSYWLTGSQKFRLMNLAQESLAGRIGIFEMMGLSQGEISGTADYGPLTLNTDILLARSKGQEPLSVQEVFSRIFNGSMPALASGKFTDREFYYSSYVRTYIERDILEEDSTVDSVEFADFIRCAASRTAQVLNVHDIASDMQMRDEKAKSWLRLLEKSGVVFYLHPYSNNLQKRTIKSPKLFFFDTGLVAYLTRYPSADVLMNSAHSGAFFENYVVSEVVKTYMNSGKECPAYYYRDKDKHEIDLILDYDGLLHPVEIKKGANPGAELARVFKVLDKSGTNRGSGAVICMKDSLSALDSMNYVVPVWMV